MNISINLGMGAVYALATQAAAPKLDKSAYSARVMALGNQVIVSAFGAEYIARRALGLPDKEASATDHTEYQVGSSLATLKSTPAVPAWVTDLYAANMSVCRNIARDGGLEPPRAWMTEFDPFALTAANQRVAVSTGALITIGVVASVAAVSLAVAWYARGKEEARAGVQTATLKQAAAVSSLTQLALAHMAAGKALPPELVNAIRDVGSPELGRSLYVPIALGGASAALVGAVLWAGGQKADAA